jgi:hypothetical protein
MNKRYVTMGMPAINPAENKLLIRCCGKIPINPPPSFIAGTIYCGALALTTYCDFAIYLPSKSKFLSVARGVRGYATPRLHLMGCDFFKNSIHRDI